MMQAIVARSGARGLVGKGYIKDIAWFFLSCCICNLGFPFLIVFASGLLSS
jgi:hypothetical protein